MNPLNLPMQLSPNQGQRSEILQETFLPREEKPLLIYRLQVAVPSASPRH